MMAEMKRFEEIILNNQERIILSLVSRVSKRPKERNSEFKEFCGC